MTERPRLLFLSQTLPYPPDGGVKIRTYNILKQLASAFDVTALCFFRSNKGVLTASVPESLEALGEFGRIEAFPIPQEQSKARLFWDHGRSVLARRSYTVYSYESAPFRERLGNLISQERFDIVHADSLDLSGYFPLLGEIPIACTHHDVQSSLLERRARQEPTEWRRVYVRHQAELMEREERRWCPRVALNVTMSELDQQRLREIAPGGRYAVAPNGVDLEAFTPEGGQANGLVFVGGASWFPNSDAMKYFCADILPYIRWEAPALPMTWVGRTSAELQAAYQGEYGVRVTGYVADVRPYVREAACYVVPIRVGGGTRIKILDAWAMGKAIVSTSVGCEGLAAADGDNILIRDEPEAFARAAIELTQNADLRARLGAAGRRTVEERYSWDAIGHGLVCDYHSLLGLPTPTE